MNEISRIRINSPRFGASLTAEVASESLQLLTPERIVDEVSCDLFGVCIGSQPDEILTFNVIIPLCNTPKDPEAVLSLIKVRVENLCDLAVGERLVR